MEQLKEIETMIKQRIENRRRGRGEEKIIFVDTNITCELSVSVARQVTENR